MNDQLPPLLRVFIVANNNSSKDKLVVATKKLMYGNEIVASYETVSNPDEAKEKFAIGKFDVVLSHQDFEGNWGDGEYLIRKLKNLDNDITTILLTIGKPRSTNGVDRQIRTTDYVEIYLRYLEEIASIKALTTTTV